MLQHEAKAAAVAVQRGVEAGLEPAEDEQLALRLAVFFAAMAMVLAQKTAAQHRGQGAGDEDGNQNRHADGDGERSEEHTSELKSLMRTSYAVFCSNKNRAHNHSINRLH